MSEQSSKYNRRGYMARHQYKVRHARMHRIFSSVLKVYRNNAFLPPTAAIWLSAPDLKPNRKWTADSACLKIDFERAVESVLSARELDWLWEYYVVGPLMGTQADILTLEQTALSNAIVRKCSTVFQHKGLYPVWRWLQLPERTQRRFDAVLEEQERKEKTFELDCVRANREQKAKAA